MSRNIWIGIIVVIVLIAGGWWYFSQPTTQQSPATASAPLPDASFNPAPGTSFTLSVGQSATDGPNGVHLKLESIGEDSQGNTIVKTTVIGKGSTMPVSLDGGVGGFLLVSGKATASAADSYFSSGYVLIKVSSVSGNTVIFEVTDPGSNRG